MTKVAVASILPTFWRRITGAKKRARVQADAEFNEAVAALRPGDLAIDLGANVGKYTVRMAETGADVTAFEPDPYAYAKLEAAVANMTNVTLVNAAVGDSTARLRLFRHRDYNLDPDTRSVSSSIVTGKLNMDESSWIDVDVIDFTDWLIRQDRAVSIIKIDIEGSEVALLERLIESPVIDRVAHIFVETHERVIPQLRRRTARLKSRTAARVNAGQTQPTFNWDWR